MSDVILHATGLYKFFGSAQGQVPVVRDVELVVRRGRFVTIMGPSGSGKSTLLHMVSGLEPPSGGRVELAGHDLWELGERERTLLRRDTIGFVFQFYNLIPNLTVEENIRLPLMIGAATGDGAGERWRELVEGFALAAKLKSYPHQLSGGEMQRVSIARALAAGPAIVMADEPTGNISTSAGEEVMALFRRSVDELGQTVLLVTHNPRDAACGDEVHFLKDGQLQPAQALTDDAVSPGAIAGALAELGI